jgi:ATP-binding cassette subfamily C protein EexD
MPSKNSPLGTVLRGCRRELAVAAVISLFLNLLLLTPSVYMLQIFRRVLQSGSEETLFMLTLMAVGAIAVWGWLSALRSKILARMSAKIDTQLGERIHAALIARALLSNQARGIQALRDLSQLRNLFAGATVQYLFDAPWTPIFIIVIYFLHPLLGTMAVVGMVLIIVLAILNDVLTRDALGAANEAAQTGYNSASTNVRNAEVVEGMGMLAAVTRRWRRHNADVLHYQSMATETSDSIQAIARALQLVLQMAVYGAGAYLVIEHELDPGPMMAGVFLMSRAIAPLAAAIRIWQQILAGKDSYTRINTLLSAMPRLARSDMQLPQPQGALAVERVTYVPPGAGKQSLKGISFALQPGEALGVIGPSAAGKSTLAKIIVGVWRPASGVVRLDGADVAAWNPDHLGPYVGYLPQDVELFEGTVRDNIARMADAPADNVIAAARVAGVHQMVLRLPQGYETEIGESGSVLSGGQRQRIGLARALFGSPRLLVLDEPNSNLDTAGEEALLQALAKAKADGTTTVIIAHRPSILVNVDKLLVLNDGAVEMFGPRAEVLARLTRKNQPREARVVELRQPAPPPEAAEPIEDSAS